MTADHREASVEYLAAAKTNLLQAIEKAGEVYNGNTPVSVTLAIAGRQSQIASAHALLALFDQGEPTRVTVDLKTIGEQLVDQVVIG